MHYSRDGNKIMPSNLLVSMSNRSEYGLVRKNLKELATDSSPVQKLGATLALYSSALDTCVSDTEWDFGGSCIHFAN